MKENEPEAREKCSFAIDVEHAKRFTALRREQRRAMAEWVRDLVEESNGGISRDEARLEARRRRSELWPTLDQHVERAVRQRLAEEDLAGPWEPLTATEVEFATLAGRGIGKNYPGYLITRTYELPLSLIRDLRTAAIRVSEGPLKELEELGLLYNSLDYTPEEYDKREELVKRVMSAPRIVRQALERFGPWPPDEHPPSSIAAMGTAALLNQG
ncbi:hypothetical protein [Streptomyces coeruleorubidus]|uniref:hypothetical protein n=1 Tax=Streptomyces coeruleorubidus TaxID=116188 RepID=UPI0033B29D99